MILTGIGMIRTVSAPISPVIQCFTANGTWSCCTGAVCIEIVTIGAGGGGRTAVNPAGSPPVFPNPGTLLGGPGGGAGGVSICILTSGFGTSQSVVVGTSSANTNGGASCFGTLVCAGGGSVGACATKIAGTSAITAAGGAGGVGNQGTSPAGGCTQGQAIGNGGSYPPDFSPNLTGQAGFASTGFPGGGGGAGSASACLYGYQGLGAAGGAGSTLCGITLGAGGTGSATTTGTIGSSFGGGGGGGGQDGQSGTFGAGAAGAPGIIQVTQYFS